jgi:hypothetical protein
MCRRIAFARRSQRSSSQPVLASEVRRRRGGLVLKAARPVKAFGQAEIVEQRADVEQLGVRVDAVEARERERPRIGPDGVVEQEQRRRRPSEGRGVRDRSHGGSIG